MIARRHFRVGGIVQGVGFRPFVYKLALSHGLSGWVRNECAGVQIEVEGEEEAIEAFARKLRESAPPLARIRSVGESSLEPAGYTSFTIRESGAALERTAMIPPDVATCQDCLRELEDPEDRRFRYPFINCTNCGPRCTIVKDIPYDRPFTTMASFTMCPLCRKEYEDPADRRFHAQPNACPACGPALVLMDSNGNPLEGEDPVAAAIRRFSEGAILAVKGLGGFHLACNAADRNAVETLRIRKHREEKPFAVMAADIPSVEKFSAVQEAEKRLLQSPERPIVLLRKGKEHGLAESVAPGNKFFGVMLPYTPLHHLLLEGDFPALVMTSGNFSEEPIAFENEDALRRLHGIADLFLLHNRAIETRADDSIARVVASREVILRRSRGFAPRPVFLPLSGPSVLAVGPDLKNTVCLTRGDAAFLSHHIGDLENLEALRAFKEAIAHLEKILDVKPARVAHDLHPRYGSTKHALSFKNLPRCGVQHHHAHIASVMAENSREEVVIGVAFDGTGYGLDGTVWGGEFLLADLAGFRRVAHLEPVPMPGGEAAVREGWRMAAAYLHSTLDDKRASTLARYLPQVDFRKLEVVLRMIERGVNSPRTSSMGRLFDAVAALCGIAQHSTFEGQAAMELEGVAEEGEGEGEAYPFSIRREDDRLVLDTKPLVRAVAEDLMRGREAGEISRSFHRAAIRMVVETCTAIAEREGIQCTALSGGCFQNAVLLEGCIRGLTAAGLRVFTHSQVPPNDGGVALGQAAVALAKWSPS